ncbi:MAG: hypothetical protein LLG45_13220 [Actinomycetia bacterium]|nr:hypothetical protein [Actinomycetes bacterium]
MTAPKNIYSEVLTVPRDEHMDFRIEVQVREEDGKLSGVLIAGKARDGDRVLDVYVKGLTAQQMIDLSRKLSEAAGIIRAREA